LTRFESVVITASRIVIVMVALGSMVPSAPPLATLKVPLTRSDPAEIVGNRGADAQDEQQHLASAGHMDCSSGA